MYEQLIYMEKDSLSFLKNFRDIIYCETSVKIFKIFYFITYVILSQGNPIYTRNILLNSIFIAPYFIINVLFVQSNTQDIQFTIRIQSHGNKHQVINPILMSFQFTGYFSKTFKRQQNTKPFEGIYKNMHDQLKFFSLFDKFTKSWYLLSCYSLKHFPCQQNNSIFLQCA